MPRCTAPRRYRLPPCRVPGGAAIAGLDVLGSSRGDGDVFRAGHTVIYIGIGVIQFIGEEGQILADEMAGFVSLHIVMVEVPVEAGLALPAEEGEEALFHLEERIETNKENELRTIQLRTEN